jgi:hypothetical protein
MRIKFVRLCYLALYCVAHYVWQLFHTIHLTTKVTQIYKKISDTKRLGYACDVTRGVYPHRAGLKNMPGHGVDIPCGQAYFSSLPGVDIHSE